MKLTKKAKSIEKEYSDGEFINIEEQETMPPPRPFWAIRKANREIKENPTMVINEISRLFNAKMRENVDVGIMTQMSAKIILSVVADNDGLSQLDIVRLSSLRPPTVSLTVNKMEEEGLVRREVDPNDKRACRIFISEAGREHRKRVFESIKQIEKIIMSGIDGQEYDILMKLLTKMRDNILLDGPFQKKK